MSSEQGANENRFETSDMSTESDPLRAALERLSTTETGLGFIYSALALLVERFNLVDAVIVLEDENVGTQIFRFEGKAVSKNFAAQLGVIPGVYCDPRVVVADDLELVRFACQRELTRHQTRLATAHEPLSATTRDVTRTVVPRPSQSSKFERAHVLVARARKRSAREVLSAVLAVVDVLTLSLTVANVHGPVRFFLGLILGIVIPGWSVVGLIKLKNPALETGLTMATSLAIVLLAAQLLITAGFWHPIVFEEFACVVSFPSLLWQSGWRRRRIDHAR